MAEACEAAGVQLFVGQVLRFFPEFVKGREIAQSGEVGRPIIARTTRGGRFPMGSSNWFGDLEQSGGVILDMMIHDLDWLRWTFGEPESIFCRSIAATREPPPDYALATIKFQNGMLAHVEASWAHYSSFSVRVEVVGENGVMELDNARTNPIKLVQRDPDGAPGLEIPENPALKNPYYLELEHFVRVMEGKEECRVSPQDGIRAVEMCEAAIKSALTGEVVSLVNRDE
jgi:predicted dehydrogenase